MPSFDEPTEVAQIKLQRMLALSTTLQNGRTADDTLANVHSGNISYYLDHNTLARPWAMVQQADDQQKIPVGGGAWVNQGALWIGLQYDVPVSLQTNTLDVDREMSRWFGKVMEEVQALSDEDDPFAVDPADIYAFIHIRHARRMWYGEVDPAKRPDLGYFYFATYEVQWGFEP